MSKLTPQEYSTLQRLVGTAVAAKLSALFNVAAPGSGTVTNVSSANTDINVVNPTTTPVLTVNKDGSGGLVGLTLFKINFKNVLNTFTSFFTNSNTAARTYTFPDKDGIVAMLSDLPAGGVASVNSGTDITVDNTDPANPIINFTGTIPPAGVASVTGDQVDNTDPLNPIIKNALHQTNGAPTVNDDNTGGFFASQMWFDLNTGILYEAFSVATGAANWIAIYTPASLFSPVNVDAAANFAAGVLTLPMGVGVHNVIVLTTAAGGNITSIAGDIPSGSTFQIKCASGIQNTIQTTVWATPPVAGNIVSNGGNLTIDGDHLDNAVFQLDSAMIVHISDSINI